MAKLPPQATPFIGREQELSKVCSLLRRSDVRLLTLIGPSGIGKTRLALQAAADLSGDFDGAVFFVPLASLSDPALVASAIADVLDVKEAGGQTFRESLIRYLHDKQLLLVLDTFEHVLPAASLVAELLAAAPRVKVLISSQAALQLYGEQQFPVPPLALPTPKDCQAAGADLVATITPFAAVRLFTLRAQAVKPDFQLTEANISAVVECCHRLDGLPLAIELAAARISFLPPQALLKRLEQRLKLLTGGARDLPARQQTLRGAIAWSYELLEPGAQELFARLGTFVGGCTLEAAEAVCNGTGDLEMDVLEGVESLVNKSLLQQEEGVGSEARFRMLQTIREYALERLDESGEAGELRSRHAAYYLMLAEQAEPELTGPEQAIWLRRLAAEHDNLRAALQWSLRPEGTPEADGERALRLTGALWRFWEIHGHLSEGRTWLAEALRRSGEPGAGSPTAAALRAKALNGAGNLAWVQADDVAARALHEESLALRRALGDKRGIATSLGNLGVVAAGQGDHVTARALHEESLALRRALGDKRGIATSLNSLAGLMLDQGDGAAARAYYEESLALLRRLGDRRGIAYVLGNLGVVAESQGDYATARTYYEESLALRRALGDKRGIATSLNNLGVVAESQGDYATARTYYEESLALRRALGDKRGIATSLSNLGLVALDLSDAAAARAYYEESLALQQELEDSWDIAASLEIFAGLAALQGQPSHALRLAGAATALREAIHAPLPPAAQVRLDRWLTPARAALSEAEAAAAWAEGQAMIPAQGLAAQEPARLPNALRIQIDTVKKAAQVAEITETDYFKELKKKAKDLRKRPT